MVDLSAAVTVLRRRAAAATAVHVVLLLAFIGGMAVTVVVNVENFRFARSRGAGIISGVAAAIGLVLVWHLVRVIVDTARRSARVVPYFREKDFRGKVDRGVSPECREAFRSGHGLVSDLPLLDALAREIGVTPLSAFGFDDDLFGDRPKWTELSEGLRTTAALATAVANRDLRDRLSSTTLEDLRNLQAALHRASETQKWFSLIARYGADEFISGVEMSKREGGFWC